MKLLISVASKNTSMKSFLINLFMLFIFWETTAAQHNLSFEHNSIDEGLSQVSINSILQKSKAALSG